MSLSVIFSIFVTLIIGHCQYSLAESNIVHYVIPADSSVPCPPEQECHVISYYMNQTLIPSYITLIFMAGEHILTDTLNFNRRINATLIGESQKSTIANGTFIEQLYPIITCSDDSIVALKMSTYNIILENLNIKNCGIGFRLINGKLFFPTVHINQLFIQNCTKYGLEIDQAYYLFITNSSFRGNRQDLIQSSYGVINITSSTFASSDKLTIIIYGYYKFIRNTISINNCLFHNNNIEINTFVTMTKIEHSYFIGVDSYIKGNLSYLVIDESQFNGAKNSRGLSLDFIDCPKLHCCYISNSIIHSYTISKPGYYGALTISCYINTYQVTLANITIRHNDKTGMYIKQCKVSFGGDSSYFIENHSLQNGGGVIVDDSAAMSSIANIYFTNNTALGVGGAIHDTTKLQKNQDVGPCPKSLRPIFVGNTAMRAGDNIYGGDYIDCVYPNGSYQFMDVVSNCHLNKRLSHFPHPFSDFIVTDPLGVCICDHGNVPNCTIRSLSVEIFPGSTISLPLATVGQCGGMSPGVFTIDVRGIHISNTNQQTSSRCKEFKYQIKESNEITASNSSSNDSTYQLNISYTNIDLIEKIPYSTITINIVLLQCPKGLKLSSGSCVCDPFIGNISGVNCNVTDAYPIVRSGNSWLYYNDDFNCTVGHINCPFDYCDVSIISFGLDEPDFQCTHNRSGILCGQCQEGQSVMLGSNQCGHCDNKYLSLIVAFIVVGFLLVLFLLMTNMTISTGSINGLLFYANIIKLNEANIFNGNSIPVLTQFISWINLDLGIETCLYDGLDDYVKTWLQFIFPVYIWLLVIGLIIGSHYSFRISRYCGNNSVPVLATLIVMSFTKLSRTITKGLMISSIKCDGRQWRNVWSVDGNIEYLTGKHIPLFVVCVVSLLLGLLYTTVIFCSQWLQKYGGKYCRSSLDPYVRLKPFIDAHTGPYKDKYRYWTGLLLIIRFILTGVFSLTTGSIPQVNNYIIMFVCVILLSYVRSKYRKKINTILEMFYLFLLCFICLLNAVSNHFNLSINIYINVILIGSSILVFCGILSVQVIVIFMTKCQIKIKRFHLLAEDSELVINEDETNKELWSPARTINRRESLIYDLDIND